MLPLRTLLAAAAVLATAGLALAQEPPQPKGQPAGRSPAPAAIKPAGSATAPKEQRARPLAGITALRVEVLPPQGDWERCGLDLAMLKMAAGYPVSAGGRLKLAEASRAQMHVRVSAVYVRRIEHCMLHIDMRVSSLQSVELAHSRTQTAVYVPLWEKADLRLAARGLALRTAQERVKLLAEAFLTAWTAEN